MSPKEFEKVTKTYTNNKDAYNLYLQGRYFWHRRTEEDVKRSIDYFRDALAIDPEYSLAYAGLGDAYHVLAWYEWYPWTDGWTKSKEYALFALKIDPELAEAHSIIGCIATWYDWDWELAEKEFKLAIELNPNYATTYQYYFELKTIVGDFDEAIELINKALEYNPNSKIMYHVRYLCQYHLGNYEKAMLDSKRVMEIDKNFAPQIWRNFKTYIKLGQDQNAITELEKIISMEEFGQLKKDELNEIYANSGIDGIIDWVINWQLSAKSEDRPYKAVINQQMIAEIYSLSNEWDSVIIYLERYAESESFKPQWIKYNADFEMIRNDPRFMVLLKRMKLNNL